MFNRLSWEKAESFSLQMTIVTGCAFQPLLCRGIFYIRGIGLL